MTCEHGRERENEIPIGGWAGPTGTCACCGTIFVFLESGSFNFTTGEGQSRVWLPKDRCRQCGGNYHEKHTPPYQKTSNPASTTIPCVHRDGCQKFPACAIEGRCCGQDAAIPATR